MFYFNFEEPFQVNDYSIENLSSFINLINEGSGLFKRVRTIYSDFPSDVRDSTDRSYRDYLALSENQIKHGFSKELRRHGLNDWSRTALSPYTIYFRGISDFRFRPIPSVYRGNYFKYENVFIDEIRVSSPDFVDGRTYIDELSALQHYGCPTRLLDLTSNPLVALYFACEEFNDVDGCVELFVAESDSVLHSNSDKVLILTALSHLSDDHKEQLLLICDGAIRALGINKALLDKTYTRKAAVKKLYQEIERVSSFEREIKCFDLLQSFYVQPAFNNLRIRAQSGLFLINGLCQDQNECAIRNENKIIAKIMVPARNKRKILQELDLVGINKKVLFPEIEDTITYLKDKFK